MKKTKKKPKPKYGEGGWKRLKDAVELQALASECDSVTDLLRAAGLSHGGSQRDLLKAIAAAAGVALPVYGGKPTVAPHTKEDPKETRQQAQQSLEATNAELRRQVEALSTQVKLSQQREHVSVHDWYGKTAKIGVLGDCHLGNKFHNPQLLKAAYKTFKREGCEAVYNPGDVCDGQNMYKGQEYELYAFGFDAQVNEVVENYPCEPDMPTYFILGNHDLSFWKDLGADFGEAVSARREDLICIGRSEHDVKIGHIIMRLSHPSGGTAYAICYSADTRVLTRDRGWVLFPDLTDEDALATLNPSTNGLEWQCPESRQSYAYSGPMKQFGGGRGHKYDVCVTPEHQMWVARPWTNKGSTQHASPPGFHFVRANEITQGRQYKLQRWANWEGVEDPVRLPAAVCKPHGRAKYIEKFTPEAFAEFLGWYLSEGCVNKANGNIEIAQCDEANRQRIAKTMRQLGLNVTFVESKVVTTCKQLRVYLARLGLSHEKYVPAEIKNMSRRLLREHFLPAYWDGDGNRYADGRFHSASTVSERLAGDLLEVLIKAGFAATYSTRPPVTTYSRSFGAVMRGRHAQHQVSVAHKSLEPEIEVVGTVEYSGRVYCATVPRHHTLLVMRNGKPCWSGNSYRTQKAIDSFSGGEKPHVLLVGHFHKMEHIFYRNVHAFQVGTIESQTDYMRGKPTPAIMGFWILTIHHNKSGVARVESEWYPYYEPERRTA